MIRIGIIGIGNIGTAHACALRDGKVNNATLHAICDISPERRQWAKENLPGVAIYDDSERFFRESGADAVILSVPHYFHPPYAIKGFAAGMHVLTEKPAGVEVSAVTEMIKAAEQSGKRFGIMWNQRTDPMYAEIRRMLQEKELGEPQRLLWQATAWYRSQEYYDSGSWRATWNGEGGGVLMNQAPHQLDLMQWIFGEPDFVRAYCAEGKYHDIEVEDDATVFCRYNNGATAVFISSTGENPGINRLEICGTTGRLVAEKRTLTVVRKVGKETVVTETKFDTSGPQHVGILNNFVSAIENGTPLLAEGKDGLAEISIANAAYLSAWTEKEIPLPVDTDAFDALLAEKKAHSKGKDKVVVEEINGEYKARWCNV